MAAGTSITYNERRGVFVTGEATVDPASIAAGANADQTIAAKGAKVGDLAFVSPQATLLDGLIISQVYVDAAGSITFTLENHTAGALDQGSTKFTWGYMRGQIAIDWAG